MNDQLQMMSKHNHHTPMMLNPPIQMVTHSQPQPPPQMINPVQSQPMSSAQMMNQPPLMLNRTYMPWLQDPAVNFGKPNFNRSGGSWKGKKMGGNLPDKKRMDSRKPLGYEPPTPNELQTHNRLKARKFYGNKKKFNNSRFAPYAPRNTTSYIIRAKKEGGIASLVSPCPVTPAVLPTPIFSPSREVLGDMAKEEWGVDGYGSMKGLIRLRSPGNEPDDEEEGSSESDVEEHVEVERRLDHDLSRFEMIYPTQGGASEYSNMLESRVDDQDTHIAQLEEENLTLKERLFLLERELGDLRRRLQFLEAHTRLVEDVNEEVVENGSENESEGGRSDVRLDYNNEDGNVEQGRLSSRTRKDAMATDIEEQKDGPSETRLGADVLMEDILPEQVVVGKYEETRVIEVKDETHSTLSEGNDDMIVTELGNKPTVEKMVENEGDESKCEVGEQSGKEEDDSSKS